MDRQQTIEEPSEARKSNKFPEAAAGMPHSTSINWNACNPTIKDGNKKWVKVQELHYRLVPDRALLLHTLQEQYGSGNFYV
jgi:hypothetical protein